MQEGESSQEGDLFAAPGGSLRRRILPIAIVGKSGNWLPMGTLPIVSWIRMAQEDGVETGFPAHERGGARRSVCGDVGGEWLVVVEGVSM
ncbi:hypothetical protein KSC_032670 [Ktedonobacter sp. SOSP1-52]|nr:hypothetical protein KSC_032670 [Ktedonobacter sp. SOSP1-52]